MSEKQAVSLNEVTTDLAETVAKFKSEWLKKHEELPEQYPLELPNDNAGLWTEFFFQFYMTGEI